VNSIKNRSSEFVRLLKEGKADPLTSKQAMESFQIMPVQRVPRYQLLLRELLKYTDETHPDYQSLQMALRMIKDIALTINDGKKLAEERQRIVDIQNNLVGNMKCPYLVQPTRRLVYEGFTHYFSVFSSILSPM